MSNEETFVITGKGRALMAYQEAQEAAADTGYALDFGEAFTYFDQEIFEPIKKHVTTELILDLTEEILENVCEDPEAPRLEELDDVAFAIGASVLHAYATIADQQEAQDA